MKRDISPPHPSEDYDYALLGSVAVAAAAVTLLATLLHIETGPRKKSKKQKNNFTFEADEVPLATAVAAARGLYPGGLRNTGTTCFANAVIQALSSCDNVVRDLHTLHSHRTNVTPTLASELYKLIRCLNTLQVSTHTYDGERLKTVLSGKNVSMAEGEQDAHELLQLLTGRLDDERTAREKAQSLADIVHADAPKHPKDSTSVSPLTGLLGSYVRCMTCGQSTPLRNTTFTNLSLPIPDPRSPLTTLSACLHRFLAREPVEGFNCWRCAVTLALETLPNSQSDPTDKNPCKEILGSARFSQGRTKNVDDCSDLPPLVEITQSAPAEEVTPSDSQSEKDGGKEVPPLVEMDQSNTTTVHTEDGADGSFGIDGVDFDHETQLERFGEISNQASKETSIIDDRARQPPIENSKISDQIDGIDMRNESCERNETEVNGARTEITGEKHEISEGNLLMNGVKDESNGSIGETRMEKMSNISENERKQGGARNGGKLLKDTTQESEKSTHTKATQAGGDLLKNEGSVGKHAEKAKTPENGNGKRRVEEERLQLSRVLKGRGDPSDAREKLSISLPRVGRVASKQLYLTRAPPTLCLHINRLYFSALGTPLKAHCFVHFDEVLDLSPFHSFACRGVQRAPLLYRLSSVIVHTGNPPSIGHFYTYRRMGQGKWVHVSDGLVRWVSLDTVLSAHAYMLFYERWDPVARG